MTLAFSSEQCHQNLTYVTRLGKRKIVLCSVFFSPLFVFARLQASSILTKPFFLSQTDTELIQGIMLSRVRLASSKQICSIRRNGSLNARFYNYAAFKRFIRLKDSSAEEERMMVEINEAFYDAQKKLMKEKKKTALRNIRINYPFVRIS